MKICKPLFLLVLFSATSTTALANIAPPNPGRSGPKSKTISARMHIGPDSRATEAKLLIPKAVFAQLRAEAVGNESNVAAATIPAPTLPLLQTAISGFFLSFSMIFGGLWFLNSRRNGRKVPGVVTALAFVALGAATSSAVFANAGPPPVARSLTSRLLIPEAHTYGAYGDIKVEIVDTPSVDAPLIELRLPLTAKQAQGE